MMTIVIIEVQPHVISWRNSGSALAKRVERGEVGGCHPEGDSAWQLLQLAIDPLHMTSLIIINNPAAILEELAYYYYS